MDEQQKRAGAAEQQQRIGVAERVVIGPGYPAGQLARALTTAAEHETAEARQHSEQRVRRWVSVLAGMLSGRLTVGSRTPVAGMPAWVTPEVLYGGFATGTALAGGPLRPYEIDLARRAGVPQDRAALFGYHLGEAGLAELSALLDSGAYRLTVPEEAALPTVAWLLRAGDRSAALSVLESIGPFAGRLRFAPAPAAEPAPDPTIVWRATAGVARASLGNRLPDPRIETMREALTVWNPFADELLTHWLETCADGRVGVVFAPDWHARGARLLARYRTLAATHRRCTKHRRPKENQAILRSALAEVVAGRQLPPRARGLLQHAVDSMLRRRGRPGSERHAQLRGRQARVAAAPGHHTLAGIVADRLARLPADAGVRAVAPLVGPVDADEARRTGVPVATPVPAPIRRVVERTRAGTVEELLAAGTVPSAEVLAEFVPRIAAATVSRGYPDEALRALVSANYLAFRARRSVLLLDLQQQVRVEELPWVRAVAGHRTGGDDLRRDARAVLRRLGELALSGFPATLLPNPLVRELAVLGREAGDRLPWVEELAADIFEGRFSGKFLAAAKLAGELLDGSLYARYYEIDYRVLRDFPDPGRAAGAGGVPTSAAFDALCRARAGAPAGWTVAANGMVIEQAQILTTHNLGTLVHRLGVRPAPGWAVLARRSFDTVVGLAQRLPGNPRPLPTIKDIAYAWRQLVFYLSVLDADTDPRTLVDGFWADLEACPAPLRERLRPALAGLGYVAVGGTLGSRGVGGAGGRRLLGWTVGPHWLADQP